jgi:hypothetical protein
MEEPLHVGVELYTPSMYVPDAANFSTTVAAGGIESGVPTEVRCDANECLTSGEAHRCLSS